MRYTSRTTLPLDSWFALLSPLYSGTVEVLVCGVSPPGNSVVGPAVPVPARGRERVLDGAPGPRGAGLRRKGALGAAGIDKYV
jgi:hypothetical protein